MIQFLKRLLVSPVLILLFMISLVLWTIFYYKPGNLPTIDVDLIDWSEK